MNGLVEIESSLGDLIRAFQASAHMSLSRIAASLDVDCSEGDYDDLLWATRRKRRGLVSDDSGSIAYRFHGAGCEVIDGDLTTDFNLFPKVRRSSHILFGPFHFVRFLAGLGFEVEASAVYPLLEAAANSELIERFEGRPGYYAIPWR